MNNVDILKKGDSGYKYDCTIKYCPSFYNFYYTEAGCNYVYNTATGAILRTFHSFDHFETFAEPLKGLLVQNGFFVNEEDNEFDNYFFKIPHANKSHPNFFTIVLTTVCNAKCFYCYEESYRKKTISDKEILSIADYLITNIKKNNSFVLDFYGGEPLLCEKQIDKIINLIKQQIDLSTISWESSITTNATLFDSRLICKAVNNWNLKTAHITIDGIESDHNKRKNIDLNGKSAFQTTLNAISKLLNSGVYVNLRIHLDNDNKKDFMDILKSLEPILHNNLHLFPTFLFPPEHETSDSYISEEQKEDLFYHVFECLINYSKKFNIISCFPEPKQYGCFATKPNTVVIAPDGSLHSCVQEFESTENWYENEKFFDFQNSVSKCSNCKFFPICIGGCIHNHYLVETARIPCVRNRYVIKPLLKLLARYYKT